MNFLQDDQSNSTVIKRRATITLAVFLLALVILVVSLADLQFVHGESYAEATTVKHTRTLKIEGVRGKILDTNGIPLAQDEISYNLEFYREYNLKSEREMYTNAIIFAIELLKKYDRELTATYAITKKDGAYVFDWGNVSEEVKAKREKTWRSDFYFADKKGLAMNCEEMYRSMREKYKIPEDTDDDMAFKVLGIWQDSIQSYWASKSITVLKNLGTDLAMAIESYSYELTGFSVTEKSLRVYPQGTVASHVIGYLGRITAENLSYYQDQNYDVESLVGISGIENRMERFLTGSSGERIGSRKVEVTNGGRILSELEYTAPKSGDNVYLTIDTNLQRIAEVALRQNIQEINDRQHQLYENSKEHYDALVSQRGGKEIQYASVGAAVVMNVKTGDVLALVSEPNYNPNLFSSGISSADYNAILNDARKPMFNKAISSSDTPGSIFKLCVSLAGLEEGVITADETMYDYGEYRKYVTGNEKGPMCGWYRDAGVGHGVINIVKAINYSCNYFFYEVADRLGIDRIKKWASALGLLEKTNIELTGESKGVVGDQKTLYDKDRPINNQDTSLPILVDRQLRSTLKECAERSKKTLTDKQLDDIVSRCFAMIGMNMQEMFSAIEKLLADEYGMTRTIVRYDTRYKIYSSIVQVTWTNTTTIQTGIGQSITTVTPIGVARYISALVNGGYVYDAHIVDKVTSANGEIIYEQKPNLVRKLDINLANIDTIKSGMKEMVTAEEDTFSIARNYFSTFKYKDQIGGKTGTAQVSDINIEDNAWFVAFAPYDDPEIAIVTYIPNGYSGSMASRTVKDIIEYYLDRKYVAEDDSLPEDHTVIY